MSEYNLSENTQDKIKVLLGNEEYSLALPTLEDIESLQQLKTDKEKSDAMFAFVKTTKEDQTPFSKEIRKHSIKVMKNFVEMLNKEFDLEN